jgi:hypothetical protein
MVEATTGRARRTQMVLSRPAVEGLPESETLVIEQMTENVLAKPVLQAGNIAGKKGV